MRHRCLICCLLLFLLAGCKETLYSDLPERQANEMLAVLLANGIAADKRPGKGGKVTLRVAKERFADAIALLHDNGFPRDRFTDLGQLFPREGLISSPSEERIRYVYGLSQQVAETLTQIDGVITARVHVVLPERNPDALDKTPLPPTSAAVFIKHRPDVDMGGQVSRIKRIVQNSVAGLPYEKISVALFPANSLQVRHPRLESVLGIVVERSSVFRLRGVLMLLVAALPLSAGVAAWLGWRYGRRRPVSETEADGGA